MAATPMQAPTSTDPMAIPAWPPAGMVEPLRSQPLGPLLVTVGVIPATAAVTVTGH